MASQNCKMAAARPIFREEPGKRRAVSVSIYRAISILLWHWQMNARGSFKSVHRISFWRGGRMRFRESGRFCLKERMTSADVVSELFVNVVVIFP